MTLQTIITILCLKFTPLAVFRRLGQCIIIFFTPLFTVYKLAEVAPVEFFFLSRHLLLGWAVCVCAFGRRWQVTPRIAGNDCRVGSRLLIVFGTYSWSQLLLL